MVKQSRCQVLENPRKIVEFGGLQRFVFFNFWYKGAFANVPVSSESSDLGNFWLYAMYACAEWYSTYQICSENLWLGLRESCLGKCVGLGFRLRLEKKIIEVKDYVQKFSVVQVIPVLYLVVGTWHLTKMFKFTPHTSKSNCQTLFLYSEKQNNRQTITGQKFRLTPVSQEFLDMRSMTSSRPRLHYDHTQANLYIIFINVLRCTNIFRIVCKLYFIFRT